MHATTKSLIRSTILILLASSTPLLTTHAAPVPSPIEYENHNRNDSEYSASSVVPVMMVANTTHVNSAPQSRIGTVVLPPKEAGQEGMRETPVIYNSTAVQNGADAVDMPSAVASNVTQAREETYEKRQVAGEAGAAGGAFEEATEGDGSEIGTEDSPSEMRLPAEQEEESVSDNIEGLKDRIAGAPLPDDHNTVPATQSTGPDEVAKKAAGEASDRGEGDEGHAGTAGGEMLSDGAIGTYQPELEEKNRPDSTPVEDAKSSYDEATPADLPDGTDAAAPVEPKSEDGEQEQEEASTASELRSNGAWPMPMRRMFSKSRFE